MEVFGLWCVLLFSDATVLEEKWMISYKTFGRKVERELSINRLGELYGKCGEDKFQITLAKGYYSWELKVPSLNGLVVAHFQGKATAHDKMSGILIVSEYPLNGRAIKWKAEKVIHQTLSADSLPIGGLSQTDSK